MSATMREREPVQPQPATTPNREQAAVGSYGRGVYAGHSTFGLDFSHQGSYGRGVYAGHSTFGLDFDTPGSYGRGVYAGQSTYDLDYTPKDSYARGMEQHRRPLGTRAPATRRDTPGIERELGAGD